MAEKLLSLC